MDITKLADAAEALFYQRMKEQETAKETRRFVVRSTFHRYLELRPYDRAWTWLAPDTRYAAHFGSLAEARAIVATLPPEMRPHVGVIVELGDSRQEPIFYEPFEVQA